MAVAGTKKVSRILFSYYALPSLMLLHSYFRRLPRQLICHIIAAVLSVIKRVANLISRGKIAVHLLSAPGELLQFLFLFLSLYLSSASSRTGALCGTYECLDRCNPSEHPVLLYLVGIQVTISLHQP